MLESFSNKGIGFLMAGTKDTANDDVKVKARYLFRGGGFSSLATGSREPGSFCPEYVFILRNSLNL